jgi:predicted DNA-binding transcriptional regulator AlpA
MPALTKSPQFDHLEADGLPTHGFVRLPQILTVIPKGRAAFLADVAAGVIPRPYKIGARAVAWRVEDIRAYIAGFKQVTADTIDPNIKAACAERARRRAELL